LSKNCEVVYYWDVTGRDHEQLTPIKLRREFLLNRKWMASGDIIPF
jgi:hypothetical protein